MKYPEKVNLGGLWLMNPHAPRCTQTNLDGLHEQRVIPHPSQFPALYADHLPALPVAWQFHFPPGFQILTGNTLPEVDPPGRSYWEPFRGTHILRQQKFWKDHLYDGASHPWSLRDPVGGSLAQEEIIHAVWYDSLTRRVNHNPPPPGVRDPHLYPFRGFCWSLCYGKSPSGLANGFLSTRGWWLIAALEPSTSLLAGSPPFVFFSAWRFSAPLADDDGFGPGSTNFSDRWVKSSDRFNPLGKNVFRRATFIPDDNLYVVEAGADSLTIEPFYG